MGGRRHPNDWERQREQLSAYIDGELSAAERAELAVKRGLTWLAKPYDMETLAETVQGVLRSHADAK
jgi:negative regulator of sigma E activity